MPALSLSSILSLATCAAAFVVVALVVLFGPGQSIRPAMITTHAALDRDVWNATFKPVDASDLPRHPAR